MIYSCSKSSIPNIIKYKLPLHNLVKGYICLDSDNTGSPKFQIPMSSVIFFEDGHFSKNFFFTEKTRIYDMKKYCIILRKQACATGL